MFCLDWWLLLQFCKSTFLVRLFFWEVFFQFFSTFWHCIYSKQADRGFATGAVFVVRLKGVEKEGSCRSVCKKMLTLRGGYGFTKKKVNPPQADKIERYCWIVSTVQYSVRGPSLLIIELLIGWSFTKHMLPDCSRRLHHCPLVTPLPGSNCCCTRLHCPLASPLNLTACHSYLRPLLAGPLPLPYRVSFVCSR